MAQTFDDRRVLGIPVLVMAMLMLNVEAFETGKSYINTYIKNLCLDINKLFIQLLLLCVFLVFCHCFCMVSLNLKPSAPCLHHFC